LGGRVWHRVDFAAGRAQPPHAGEVWLGSPGKCSVQQNGNYANKSIHIILGTR